MNSDFLRLISLSTEKVEEDEHGYVVHASPVRTPVKCPSCRSSTVRKYGVREQTFNDCPIHGKHVSLQIRRQRYRCMGCGKVWHGEISDLSDGRRTTKRLQAYIEKQSLERTFVDLARETGIDEKSIRNIFRDYISRLANEIKFDTPKWMGIDEIHIISKPRAVITNIQQNTVVEILPNRNKPSIMRYLSLIDKPHAIHYVAMDMWRPYRDAVREVLPHAKIVVDKFHILRMANQAMEAARKTTGKTSTAGLRRKLMRSRFVLLKRFHDLTEEEVLSYSGWVENYPLLGEVHAQKEGFFSIWDSKTRGEAETAYDRWQDNFSDEVRPYFNDLTRAMTNWRSEVFNYFDHPITNVYTESVNSLIRVMNRLGRGYSFDALRARVLFTEGVQKQREKSSTRGKRRDSYEMGRVFSWEPTTVDSGRDKPEIQRFGADIATLVRWIEEGRL